MMQSYARARKIYKVWAQSADIYNRCVHIHSEAITIGDRVSISFVNGKEESVVLFSHWGGTWFVDKAAEYVKQLKDELADANQPVFLASGPLGRLEPRTVMVDFIRHITTGMHRVANDLYLGKDETDGDNSNQGHWRINLVGLTEEVKNETKRPVGEV